MNRRVLRVLRSAPRSFAVRIALNTAFAVYAFAVLLRIERSLARNPLDETCRSFGIQLGVTSGDPGDPMPWGELHRAAARAWRITSRWPFGDTCLRRCLLLGALMRDFDPGMVIGVKRDEEGEVVAHSWLTLAGRSVDPTSREYLSLR